MPNRTKNYLLTKPLQTEFYDVDVQNGNMDIIDQALTGLEEKKTGFKVLAVRDRTEGKPDYGLGGGGEEGGTAVLKVKSFTGTAEISAVVSGTEYDAENMATPAQNLPNGTLIIKKLEE